jgi:hypothetical protein
MWCLYLDIRSPLPTGRAWVHSRYEVGRALSLVAECLDDCEVSLRTGISRRTILDSRHGRAPHASGTRTAPEVLAPAANLDRSTTRLLVLIGSLSGDGWLSRDPRTYRPRIVQDLRYPNLIELAITSIKRVRDGKGTVDTSSRSDASRSAHRGSTGLALFPQHRPGSRQACDGAQIAHSSSKPDTISIVRREAVAALDAFIGPKS